MTRLTTLNLPEFHRATVGFDRMFQNLDRQFAGSSGNGNYPPYNIVQINDDEYMISVAVAGFGMDNLDVTQDGSELEVSYHDENRFRSWYERSNSISQSIQC